MTIVAVVPLCTGQCRLVRANSSVRQALGVAAPGPGILSRQIGIYVEAPLGHLVANRPAALYFIENAAISGLFAAVDNADRWVFYTARPPDWDQAADGLPARRCVELVRLAAGLPDLAGGARAGRAALGHGGADRRTVPGWPGVPGR